MNDIEYLESLLVTARRGNLDDTYRAFTESLVRRIDAQEKENSALKNELKDFNDDFPCDGGCHVEYGPMEECSRHGRKPYDLWRFIGEMAERNRRLDRQLKALQTDIQHFTNNYSTPAGHLARLLNETLEENDE